MSTQVALEEFYVEIPRSLFPSAVGEDEHIQSLPPELREKIRKEHTALKIREKKEAGWDQIHHVIQKASSNKLDPTGDFKIFYCDHCLHLKNGIVVSHGVEEGEEPIWNCLPCADVFEYLNPELLNYSVVSPQFFENPFSHLKRCKYKKRYGKNGPIECPCLGRDRKRLETAWVEHRRTIPLLEAVQQLL